MPGALFRWRQELVRDSTRMYIPGLSAHHSRQETGWEGQTHHSWSPHANACSQAPSSSPAWKPVSLCPRRSPQSPKDPFLCKALLCSVTLIARGLLAQLSTRKASTST